MERTHIRIYKHLKGAAEGMLGDEIKWNFTKFLVSREGEVLDRFASITTPKAWEATSPKRWGLSLRRAALELARQLPFRAIL